MPTPTPTPTPTPRRTALTATALACTLLLTAPTSASGSAADRSASPSSSPSSDGTSSEVADLATPQTSSDGVAVSTYGAVVVRPYQSAQEHPVVLALHGVQRVDGATVVYFSAGWTDDDPGAGGLSEIAAPGAQGGGYTDGGSVGSVRLVDVAGGLVYRTLVDPRSLDGPVTEPFGSRSTAFPTEPGVMGTMFAVLPELPSTTERVTVDLLFGVSITDVPVGEGALEPALDPDEVVPLGTGWPEVDTGALGDLPDAAAWTYPLSAVTESLDGSQVVTEQGETVTVDLAADVLFAVDQADLTPAAAATLDDVAARLTADGATGQVTVVGHTDGDGSDAYNLDLSLRRAGSVAAVLQPALAGTALTFAVDGRGEAEPVADNSTPEGRQANRRVTVTYTAGDS